MQHTGFTHTAPPPRFDHLAPCPECGGTAEVTIGHLNDPNAFDVPCNACDAGYVDLDEVQA